MFGYMGGLDNDLFEELERMRRQMDVFRGWPGASGIRSAAPGTFPAINVGASPDRVDVYVFAAGVDPKSLDVSLQDHLLTIAGERKDDRPEDVDLYRRERFTGAFRRVVALPEDVDQENVNAAYRDGVLHVSIARHQPVKARRIEVK